MTYTVKKGDTLSEIAHKHNTTVGALVALNGITNPHVIHVGQVLTVSEAKPREDNLRDAIKACLDAIEELDEFQRLSGLLEED